MTSLSRPGQPAAARGFGHAGLALLGLALLLAMLLWQGVLRHPWPTAEAWLAPLSSTPSLDGLLLWWTQLPRAFAGVLVGACLGVSGAIMLPVGVWGSVRLTSRVSGRSREARSSRSSCHPVSKWSSIVSRSAPIARGVSRLVA